MDDWKRYAQDDQSYSSRSAGLPRGVRPQRSMADIPSRSTASRRDRDTAPRLPQTPRKRDNYYTEPRSAAVPDRFSNVSTSSESSRASSAFSRRGQQAYESSTSIEELNPKTSRQDWGSSQRRQRPNAQTSDVSPNDGNASHARRYHSVYAPEDAFDDVTPDAELGPSEGYGASLWNRVASAANTLTVNVSKAWASGLFTEDGPVTPEGGESRLTQALKSYHLSKARTASDLPSWLFSEEERRVTRGSFTSREEERTQQVDMRPPRQRGLRAIYAEASESSSPPERDASTPNYTRERRGGSRFNAEPEERYEVFSTTAQQSKATSRLQAMRDARRPNERTQRSPVRHVDDYDNDAGALAMQASQQEIPLRRVGLPSAPKPRRSRS